MPKDIVTKYEIIRISSTRDIVVNQGVKSVDETDPVMDAQNKLKSKEFWTDTEILLTQGNGYYPKFIAEWESVKILDDLGIINVNSKVLALEDIQDEKERQAVKAIYDKVVKNNIEFTKADNNVKKINEQKKEALENKSASLLAKALAGNVNQAK